MDSLHTGSMKGISERDAFWDNAKFLLIVLVVAGHFLEPFRDPDYFWPRYLFTVIYTFHMPAFIFISGLFSKSVISGKRFRLERVITFLILYVSYKIIGALLSHFLWQSSISIDFFYEGGLAWYLLAMAAWFMLTYLVKDIRPVITVLISITLAFLVGFSTGPEDVLAYFRVINYWPFFLLGFYLNREKTRQFLSQKWLRILGIVGLIAFLFLTRRYIDDYWTYIRLFTGRNSYMAIADLWDGFHVWYRLLYYPFVIAIGICVLSIVPRRRAGFLTNCGSRTLPVYYLHIFVKEIFTWFGCYAILTNIFAEEKYWTVALILIAVLVSLGLSIKGLNRPFDWLMRRSYQAIFRKTE